MSPKILATGDAPFLEHGFGHRPEKFQRALADALQQFLSADVFARAAFLFLEALLGEVEGLAHEDIRLAMETGILRLNPLKRFVKT